MESTISVNVNFWDLYLSKTDINPNAPQVSIGEGKAVDVKTLHSWCQKNYSTDSKDSMEYRLKDYVATQIQLQEEDNFSMSDVCTVLLATATIAASVFLAIYASPLFLMIAALPTLAAWYYFSNKAQNVDVLIDALQKKKNPLVFDLKSTCDGAIPLLLSDSDESTDEPLLQITQNPLLTEEEQATNYLTPGIDPYARYPNHKPSEEL